MSREKSGIDWEEVGRDQALPARKRKKTYRKTTCPRCGRTISEGAYSGASGNYRKHAKACQA